MNSTVKSILTGFGIFLACGLGFGLGTYVEFIRGTKPNLQKIEKLDAKIDSLNKLLLQVDREAEFHQNQVDSLKWKLTEQEKIFEKKEKQYNEKINSIATYTNPELEQFFAERYK